MYIRAAMHEAEKAVKEGDAPFGVVVVDGLDHIIWRDHDRVQTTIDPTAHGEINAIRGLCHAIGKTKLEDTCFFTTSEPCPTCMSAMIKVRVKTCVFGAETEMDASLPIPAAELASKCKLHRINVIGGIIADECRRQRIRLTSNEDKDNR